MKLRIRRKQTAIKIANVLPSQNYIKYAGTWSPQLAADDTVTSASYALAGAIDEAFQAVKVCLPPVHAPLHQPINVGHNTHLTWATWHHGKEYETFWFGDVMTLLYYAHVTDTEREQLMLNARKAESRGRTAYATARNITASVPSKPQIDLTHVGLVFTAPFI